jgi:hypothetical protein
MKFPGLKYIFVSSAPKHMLYEDGANGDRIVYSYSNLHEDIRILPRQTKQKMAQQVTASSTTQQVEAKFPQIDYAIITALYDDEFEEIEKVFEWQPDDGHIETATKLFRLGHVKGKPEKRIVAAVPSATGMIDSAIVATMILEYFKPKYLFMTGVCGGVPKLNFGSIILAS